MTPAMLRVLLSAATLAAFATPAAAQSQVVGTAASVVGDVELSNATITRPQPVQLRRRIAWGDLIHTGHGAQMQILLLDRTTFGIGPRSNLRIDRYVYDPTASRSLAATLLEGALRFLSGRQASGNNADITTPSGRIGIRGTALDLLVGEHAKAIARDEPAVGGGNNASDAEATLVILRGPGPGTAGGLTPGLAEVTAAGVTVRLDRPGMAAYIPRNGAPPIGPFQISDAGLGKVIDRVSATVERANDGSLLGDILPVAAGVAAVVGVALLTDGNGDGGQTVTTPNDVPNSTVGGPTTAPNGPIN
jgi:FecR protein